MQFHQNHHSNHVDTRIQRILQTVRRRHHRNINRMPTFSFLLDRSQFKLIRGLWLLILLNCFTLCCYQTTKRLLLYKSTPIAVDVDMAEESDFVFPALSVCAEMTDPISDLLNGHPGKMLSTHCGDVFLDLVSGRYPGYDVATLWKMADISKSANASIFTKTTPVATPQRKNTEISPYGTCATFTSGASFPFKGSDQKMVVEIRNQKPSCSSSLIHGSTHGVNAPFSIRNMWAVGMGSENSFTYTVTQYRFLSHRKRRCTRPAKFAACFAKCKKKVYEEMPCKFPFFPPDTNLPWCEPSNETSDFFIDAKSMYMRFQHNGTCNCRRPCTVTQLEELRLLLDSNSNTNSTIISMYYSTNLVRVMTERYAYDLISLLCDVGGNSGLYLGISLLSIFEFVYNLSQLTHSRHIKSKAFPTDPLFKKVRALYYEYVNGFKSGKRGWWNQKCLPETRNVSKVRTWEARQKECVPMTFNSGPKKFLSRSHVTPRETSYRSYIHTREFGYEARLASNNCLYGTKYRELKHQIDHTHPIHFKNSNLKNRSLAENISYAPGMKPNKQTNKLHRPLSQGGFGMLQWNQKLQTQTPQQQTGLGYGRNLGFQDVQRKPASLNCDRFFTTIRKLLLFSFSFISAILIAERIMYYARRPTYTTVDVLENETLFFPSLMICMPSKNLTQSRIDKAKTMGIEDYCQVDLLDIIESDMDAVQLWNLSDNKYEFLRLEKSLIKYQPRYRQTSFPLPIGSCQRYDIAPIKYAGWHSFFCLLSLYRGVCDEKYYTLYFTPQGEEVNLASYIHVPIDGSIEVSFTVKKQINNPAVAPCATTIQAEKCKGNCVQKMLSGIKCRLPYMNYLDHMPFCSISSEAKLAQSIYLKVLLGTDSVKDCNCLRKCEITVYNVHVFIFLRGIPAWFTAFTFRHPYVEVFHEELAYHWEKLFCDIGGILGLMMGVSVYSLSTLVRNAGMRIYRWCRYYSVGKQVLKPALRIFHSTY